MVYRTNFRNVELRFARQISLCHSCSADIKQVWKFLLVC